MNILKSFKDLEKPKPLAKKAEELEVPKPTQPNIAKSLGHTDKQAQMSASPQAQQATQRTAQLQSQAPREVPEAGNYQEKADALISAAAGLEGIETTQAGQISGSSVDTGAARTEEQIANQLEGGEVLDIDPEQALADAMLSESFTDSLNITLKELEQTEGYADLTAYAAELGLDENATLAQIKEAMDTEINEISTIVDNAKDVIHDPNAPANVRQAAMQDMLDYGASHMLATDAELDELEKDISEVGLIEFDGQMYTLEDLKENDAVAATLHSAALSLIQDPDATPEDLGLADSPLMLDFVLKHAPALASVLEQDKENLAAAKEKVDTNKEAMNSMGEELQGLLGLNPYTTQDLTADLPGLKALGENLTEGYTGESVKAGLDYMVSLDPELVQDFMTSGNPKYLKEIMQKSALHDKISNNTSPAVFAELAGVDFSHLGDLVMDAHNNPEAYTDEQLAQLKLFDNGEGFIADNKTLQSTLADYVLDGSLNLRGLETTQQKRKTYMKDLFSGAGVKSKKDIRPKYDAENKLDLPHADTALRKMNNLIREMKADQTGYDFTKAIAMLEADRAELNKLIDERKFELRMDERAVKQDKKDQRKFERSGGLQTMLDTEGRYEPIRYIEERPNKKS